MGQGLDLRDELLADVSDSKLFIESDEVAAIEYRARVPARVMVKKLEKLLFNAAELSTQEKDTIETALLSLEQVSETAATSTPWGIFRAWSQDKPKQLTTDRRISGDDQRRVRIIEPLDGKRIEVQVVQPLELGNEQSRLQLVCGVDVPNFETLVHVAIEKNVIYNLKT
jgi:hypothetical protein